MINLCVKILPHFSLPNMMYSHKIAVWSPLARGGGQVENRIGLPQNHEDFNRAENINVENISTQSG